jgi:radical SAM protein with 4Fe4S-binding SPASM domain
MDKVRHFSLNKSVSWAVIELTDFCNFNCAWCYASTGCKSEIRRRQMSLADLKKLIRSLADSGVRQVTYSGGEPTMYPHIREAIRYAKNHGMVVHMNTNGYLLTRKLVRDLTRLGLSQMEINIDSIDPEKHDRIRGKKGSFRKVIEALKLTKEAGITCVVQTVMTSENENEITSILKLARSFGVQRYRLWDVMPSGEAANKLGMRPKKYMKILRYLDDFTFREGAKSIEAGEPLFPLDYKTKLKVIDSSCVCAAGLLMNVSAAGDVYFCCTYRKPFYNVFDAMKRGDVIKDYHKAMLKVFLESMRIPQKCRSCSLFDRCGGGCPTRSGYTRNGVDYWCKN